MSQEPIAPKPTRFIPIETFPPDITPDSKTVWWWDTQRPEPEGDEPGYPFIAVQTYIGKNPNEAIIFQELFILFTDPLEYYFVCGSCYDTHSHQQWSGSSRGPANFQEVAHRFLEKWLKLKGWCQFCDEVFGNGGWRKR